MGQIAGMIVLYLIPGNCSLACVTICQPSAACKRRPADASGQPAGRQREASQALATAGRQREASQALAAAGATPPPG